MKINKKVIISIISLLALIGGFIATNLSEIIKIIQGAN